VSVERRKKKREERKRKEKVHTYAYLFEVFSDPIKSGQIRKIP
jgi:hypothetical protein